MTKPAPTIIPGTRYTHLVTTGVYIPSNMDVNKKNIAKVQCKCDCGNITYKRLSDLIKGRNTTCGKECHLHKPALKHGLSLTNEGKQVKEYQAWNHMKQKFNNPKYRDYQKYASIGITICKDFSDSFEFFFEHIGRAPSLEHQFRRIDKSGNYEPGNVHWYLAKKRTKK